MNLNLDQFNTSSNKKGRYKMDKGIDYGRRMSNIDNKTGIRYGVISQHSIMSEAMDDFEYDYGDPTCPKCGNEVKENKNGDYRCKQCKKTFQSYEVYGEEAIGFTYEMNGYILTDCLDTDIMIIKSPYYTYAQFCSPCVPGAGNLDNPMEEGIKTYCLGADWFEDEKVPYPLYDVKTGERV